MRFYKIVAIGILIIAISYLVFLAFTFQKGVDVDLLTFDFVALDFSTTQYLSSRLFQAFDEFRNIRLLNSLQYNTLPVLFSVEAILMIIVFITNVKRWQNVMSMFIQCTMQVFIIQELYVFMLNSSKSFILMLIAGITLAVSCLYLVSMAINFLYVKFINPFRRGYMLFLIGMLAIYKEHLCQTTLQISIGQFFNVIIIMIIVELTINFLNLMEGLILNAECNHKPGFEGK